MLSTYPKDFIRQQEGREYATPEPDEVLKDLRALGPEIVEFIETEMRKKYSNFWIDYDAEPTHYIEDGVVSIGYDFVSECERERDAAPVVSA